MTDFILRKGAARLGVLGHLFQLLNSLRDDSEWLVKVEKYDRAAKHRTLEQNRLQFKWHMEAAMQLKDESAEDKRAYCKLHFGVPILRAESEEFRGQYDQIIRPLPYEQKLALMKAPIDFPVSRLMSVEQSSRYLDSIRLHYMGQGVMLTIPEAA